MGKCDFCHDELDAGRQPVCVAACPMRALEFVSGISQELVKTDVPLAHPMPAYSHTEPRLFIKPHEAAERPDRGFISNREEVKPGQAGRWGELPLVVFTLLAQAAVGVAWCAGVLRIVSIGGGYHRPILIISFIAFFLGICALGASIFHLGAPFQSWRALGHLGKSWLSREVLYMVGFTGSAGMLVLSQGALGLLLEDRAAEILGDAFILLACILGALEIHSMARVYRLKTISTWNSWFTSATFLLSAWVLGLAILTAAFVFLPKMAGIMNIRISGLAGIGFLFVPIGLLEFFSTNKGNVGIRLFRKVILISGFFGCLWMLALPEHQITWAPVAISFLVLLEEIAARWIFYQALEEKVL